MTTDIALIEKREELKRRLAAGEYKTLVDVFLERFDRLLRKITRQTKPLPLWLITIILALVINLITNAGIYMAGDWTASLKIYESQGLELGLGTLLSILINTIIVSMPIIINQRVGRIFSLWHDYIIDATESTSSLGEFEEWLKKTCNWRLHLLFTVITGILSGLYVIAVSSFMGYGILFANVVIFMFSTAALYLYSTVILLSAELHKYDLKLFPADPSSSELLSHLSGVFSFVVYFVAIIGAMGTLIIALDGFSIADVVVLCGVWLPIIAFFILNQTSLSSMIRRAKWKTLNEAQEKIEKLRASKSFGSPKTMAAINLLMDFHDRVKATRNSALNSGAILSFINSLLLPLLAFLLGNLDKLMALLPQRP